MDYHGLVKRLSLPDQWTAPSALSYLYPMGRRTPLTGELAACDVDVSWWVTPDAYEHGHYTRLYAALQRWISTRFPFSRPYYSNTEIPQ